MYRIDTESSLILLVSEMLNFPRVKFETHLLRKLAFLANKYLGQDRFRESLRTTENLSKYTAVREKLRSQIFLYSRIIYKAILVSELYWLPRCIVSYKQSLT